MQNKLKQSKESLETLQKEKTQLDNTHRVQHQDLTKHDNQKKLLHEHNRRLQTGLSDLKHKIADVDSVLSTLKADVDTLRQNNDFRENENAQLAADLHQLEQHLDQLDSQNKVLEQELENFVQQEDQVKVTLTARSRSPSKAASYREAPMKESHHKSMGQSMASTK